MIAQYSVLVFGSKVVTGNVLVVSWTSAASVYTTKETFFVLILLSVHVAA